MQPTHPGSFFFATFSVGSLVHLQSINPPLLASLPSQVRAGLIVVYTHTGQTAELVAKYRPPVPILTLVVPHLVVDNLKWKMEGRWVQGLPSVGGRGSVRPKVQGCSTGV